MRATGIVLAGIALLLATPCAARAQSAQQAARHILERSGVQGGLIVHVGCEDAALTAALRADERYVVQGLEVDAAKVERARVHIRSLGQYGPVSVARWDGQTLPYAENLVNLIVVSGVRCQVSDEEIERVLAPGGVALELDPEAFFRKPWPDEIDEWTHYLHGPDNNAVAADSRVGPPRHMQWTCGPAWCRSHDHLASVSGLVSANGRIFYIVDLGPIASVACPAQWFLIARDAFSGVKLWTRRVAPWEWHFRGFRSGPAHLARRLVAVGDRVYVTLGLDKPVTALDAASGELIRSYDETEGTEEILCSDGMLFVVIGNPTAMESLRRAWARDEAAPAVGKSIMALRADTGEVLWKRTEDETGYVMPSTLAVAGSRVFYQNAKHVACLDRGSGRELWRAPRPITRSRPTWLAPTLVVHDGMVFSADRDVASTQAAGEVEPGEVKWKVRSREAYRVKTVPVGELVAFSAETGEQLWSCPACEGFNSPVDVLVCRDLVWTGEVVRAGNPGITKGRDPRTGKVKFERPPDQEFFRVGMGHHRCYRNKATLKYLVMGRSGIEWIDLDSGEGLADHWVRGTCQYGVMPSGGLIYAPPHSCACYIKAKLKGFNALAPKRESQSPEVAKSKSQRVEESKSTTNATRLEKEPAYDQFDNRKSQITNPVDWPTYRHDAARSGKASCAVPAHVGPLWKASLGGRLSSPVMADGKLLVAAVDEYAVHALDARTGEAAWSYTVGGRVDSPPTVHEGRTCFGSADGWVYCLRASDGELIWRFQAAPQTRWVVDRSRVESAWPVHGSVLVENGVVYFAAGRSSFLDGGIYLYGLDPQSGEQLFCRRLSSRDPETGREPQSSVQGLNMPGALPDILSSNGNSIFMRHKRFNMQGIEQEQNVPHLYSAVGFLDDSWWHRTYWIVGTQTGSGFGGWRRPGKQVPSGRLLVTDGSEAYGFGRDAYLCHGEAAGGHPGLGRLHYELFATKLKEGGRGWSTRLPFWVRAMVLADNDTLFVAGPPVAKYFTEEEAGEGDVVLGPWYGDYSWHIRDPDKALQALEGKEGARLWAVSATEGEKLATYQLSSLPVFDGVIAAAGRLYICTTEGDIVCMGAQ